MTDALRIEDIERLVLVWLVVPRKRPSLEGVAKVLSPFLRGTGAAPESIARQCLGRLKSRGDIEADTTWMLSAAGREKALAALGVPALPKRPSWKWVHSLLVARGHGEEPTPAALRRMATTDGLAAAVLEKHHRIKAPPAPTLTQVGHAIAWRELGVESTEPFTLKAVLIHIAQKVVGAAATPEDSRAALGMLAAAAAGASRGDAPLRAALVKRWMAQEKREVESAAPPASPDVESASLEAFSRRALDAARSSPTGRWGEHKVFVSHAWSQYQKVHDGSALDLESFKNMLVRANRARLLFLSRADLVEEMNAEDVRRSEIASLGTTFHFIRVD